MQFGRGGNLNLIIAVLLVAVLCMGVILSYLSARPFSPSMDTQVPSISRENPIFTASESAFVRFDSAQTFTPDQKASLIQKIAYPYRDYVAYIKGDGPVAYVEFSRSTAQTGASKIVATALHKNGAERHIAVNSLDTVIQWWTPTCSKTKICLFSPEFEQKYPELLERLDQ